jgi:hypothetical protein
VDQVHLIGHGDATGVSLAYHYDQWRRLADRISKFDGASGTENEKAVRALRDEDALLSGLFTRGLDAARLSTIKAKFVAGASWQIWGCWAGEPDAVFGHIVAPSGVDPAVIALLNRYFGRFNFGAPSVPGVAVDIAKGLGIMCTAARDGWGLAFWHGEAKKAVVRNDTATRPNKPYWLWNAPGSRFVTYKPDGSRAAAPMIFGKARTVAEIAGGAPPKWLTDLYW